MKYKPYLVPIAFIVGWTLGSAMLITAGGLIVYSEKKQGGPQWRP